MVGCIICPITANSATSRYIDRLMNPSLKEAGVGIKPDDDHMRIPTLSLQGCEPAAAAKRAARSGWSVGRPALKLAARTGRGIARPRLTPRLELFVQTKSYSKA